MSDKQREYICESRLIGERGWTKKLIQQFLGEPDKEVDNPHYSSAPSMRLYKLDRIKEAEARDDVQKLLEKVREQRSRRRKAAKEVARRKRKELIDYVKSLKIKVPKLKRKTLYKRALEHYNALWVGQRGKFEKYVSENPDEHDELFLARIAVNMLRHEYTSYETHIVEMFGKVGKQEGIKLLKKRILEKIKETYSDMEPIVKECNRQLNS